MMKPNKYLTFVVALGAWLIAGAASAHLVPVAVVVLPPHHPALWTIFVVHTSLLPPGGAVGCHSP